MRKFMVAAVTAVTVLGVLVMPLSVSAATTPSPAWHPTRSRETAMHNSMLITSQGLWIGSDGANAAGQSHNDLVLFPYEWKQAMPPEGSR